jgi:hypothetical protein
MCRCLAIFGSFFSEKEITKKKENWEILGSQNGLCLETLFAIEAIVRAPRLSA